MSCLISLAAGVIGIILSFHEVGLPWAPVVALLAFAYTFLVAMGWGAVSGRLKMSDVPGWQGVVINVVTTTILCLLPAIPYLLIIAVPGPTPSGVLGFALAYGTFRGFVPSRSIVRG